MKLLIVSLVALIVVATKVSGQNGNGFTGDHELSGYPNANTVVNPCGPDSPIGPEGCTTLSTEPPSRANPRNPKNPPNRPNPRVTGNVRAYE